MNKQREEGNDDLQDGQEAIIYRATPRLEKILGKPEAHGGSPMTLGEIVEAEKPTRKRKQRSDKGKPKLIAPKATQPTADPNKRKHLALVDKLYGLKEKRLAVQIAIDETVAEINALVDAL